MGIFRALSPAGLFMSIPYGRSGIIYCTVEKCKRKKMSISPFSDFLKKKIYTVLYHMYALQEIY